MLVVSDTIASQWQPMETSRVELNLSQHCIQTAAKHEYQRLIRHLLGTPSVNSTVEFKIALLTEFLEQTDFRQLRADHPDLTGGSPVVVALSRDSADQVVWSVLPDRD